MDVYYILSPIFDFIQTGFLNKESLTESLKISLSEEERALVAASFQEAACEIMVSRTLNACRKERIGAVAVGGGVACNKRLRELFKERAAKENVGGVPIQVFFPPPVLCTDNAAMSAGLAYHRLKNGERDGMEMEADPTPHRA